MIANGSYRRWMVFLAGLCVFGASFFLPAVNAGGQAGRLKGWVCAWFALFHGLSWDPLSLLLVPAGLVNPLIVLYAALRVSGIAVRFHRPLAVSAVVCVAASWAFLALTHAAILIGHVAWVAGILLIVAKEARALK